MASTEQREALPHWDLGTIYPDLESDVFLDAAQDLRRQIDELESFMKDREIAQSGRVPASSEEIARQVKEVLDRINQILALQATLDAYITGFVTTDSFNTLAARRMSELEMTTVRFKQLEVRFRGWLGAVAASGAELDRIIASEATLEAHDFALHETISESRYLMSEAEEELAAQLSLSGASAWGRLQGTVTSQIALPFEQDGETVELPITAIMNIRRYDPDESRRRRAFEVEISAWDSMREPLAACMNGIKGAVNTLNARRGREDSLHKSIVQARLDRKTLETMLGVMKESFPMFRRYFKGKANFLGKDALAWWDVFAPIGEGERVFSYGEARDYILDIFKTFNSNLFEFTQRAFDSGWIDAEPRKGKRGGAFCMEVPLLEESRILCNFDGSLDQLLTIAHELGHAFHNECQKGLTMIQRSTPMTLAETASIFNETLVTEAALRDAESAQEELAILETFLISASQVIVDIYSRYLFEQEVFERRVEAELSPDDFCEIMARAQRETYGEGLDPDHQHAYMWAWKPHYYSESLSYYNYPYAFGLLFGLGLFAIYQERGAEFFDQYRQLLRETGMGTAAELANRFGIQLDKPDFWRSSMRVIEKRVERYQELLKG
jgi:pepF/M3 family oligoendopeptidase